MRGTEVSEFIDLAYTWQERAIKAEAEVERLKPIEEFADKNFKLWENAALYQYARHLFDLKHILDEYQAWKEGQK